jgi:hypothetical protein
LLPPLILAPAASTCRLSKESQAPSRELSNGWGRDPSYCSLWRDGKWEPVEDTKWAPRDNGKRRSIWQELWDFSKSPHLSASTTSAS